MRYFYQFIDKIAEMDDWSVYVVGGTLDVVNDRQQKIYSTMLPDKDPIAHADQFCRQLGDSDRKTLKAKPTLPTDEKPKPFKPRC